jgi:hypothetical protein
MFRGFKNDDIDDDKIGFKNMVVIVMVVMILENYNRIIIKWFLY